jgi:hypothetical protein
MHVMDRHTKACAFARQATIEKFGADSVPCKPGTEAHKFWLSKYDEFIREN